LPAQDLGIEALWAPSGPLARHDHESILQWSLAVEDKGYTDTPQGVDITIVLALTDNYTDHGYGSIPMKIPFLVG